MIHSLQRLGQRLSRRPDEEELESAPQPQEDAPTDSLPPYADAAKHILWHEGARVHGLPFSTLADLWDEYHLHSKNSAELAKKLEKYSVPDSLKHSLFIAKQKSDAAPSRVERVVAAIHRIAAMPRDHVEIGEKHKHVLSAVMKAIGVGKSEE